MVFEYKNDINAEGKIHRPYWVANGGQMFNPVDKTYLGSAPDDREYKVPDSIASLDLAGVKTRALGIHAVTPYTHEGGGNLTNAEVEALATEVYNHIA